jgi:hypothetical protein
MNPYDNAYKEKKGFPFAAVAVILVLLAVALAGLAVYLYPQKEEAKARVEAEAAAAVDVAQKEQLALDQKAFDIEVAKTTRKFESARDFGAINFEYPETWSAYVDFDGTGKDTSTYAVYFNPGMVNPVDEDEIYTNAVVLSVKKGDFATASKAHEKGIKDGVVWQDSFALNNGLINATGVRYSGNISAENKDKTGTVIYFTLRDKLLALYNYGASAAEFYDIIFKTMRWTQ